MSIVLMPSTPEELAKIIAFLDQNQMNYHVPLCYHPMESEDLFTNNKEDLVALLTAVQNKQLLEKTVIEKNGWLCYMPNENYTSSVKWYKPTPEFKSFCGTEFCNPLGHITLEMAESVVLLHAKARYMATSTSIDLSDILQTALNTTATKLSIIELNKHLQSIFTPV